MGFPIGVTVTNLQHPHWRKINNPINNSIYKGDGHTLENEDRWSWKNSNFFLKYKYQVFHTICERVIPWKVGVSWKLYFLSLLFDKLLLWLSEDMSGSSCNMEILQHLGSWDIPLFVVCSWQLRKKRHCHKRLRPQNSNFMLNHHRILEELVAAFFGTGKQTTIWNGNTLQWLLQWVPPPGAVCGERFCIKCLHPSFSLSRSCFGFTLNKSQLNFYRCSPFLQTRSGFSSTVPILHFETIHSPHHKPR